MKLQVTHLVLPGIRHKLFNLPFASDSNRQVARGFEVRPSLYNWHEESQAERLVDSTQLPISELTLALM